MDAFEQWKKSFLDRVPDEETEYASQQFCGMMREDDEPECNALTDAVERSNAILEKILVGVVVGLLTIWAVALVVGVSRLAGWWLR